MSEASAVNLTANAMAVDPEVKTRGNGLRRITLSEVEMEPVHWLWPGRIPRGKLTIVGGDPEQGKTFITLDLAARLTRATEWPDRTPAPVGGVLVVSTEDDVADTIKPRLVAAGAD